MKCLFSNKLKMYYSDEAKIYLFLLTIDNFSTKIFSSEEEQKAE